jgi:hypothetical protein
MVALRQALPVLRSLTHAMERELVLWGRHLAEILPRPWQKWLASEPQFRVQVIGDSYVLSESLNNGEGVGTAVEHLDSKTLAILRRKLVGLRLPREEVLCRTVEIPRAAVPDLGTTAAHALSTWTPFAWDDVYAIALPFGSVRGSVQPVELRCILKSIAQHHVAHLEQRRIPVDALELGDDRFGVPLPSIKRRSLARSRYINLTLAAAACLQVSVLLAIWWSRQVDELGQLQGTLQTLAREARERSVLQQQVVQTERMLEAVAGGRTQDRLLSRKLVRLAEALPPGATFREFELTGDQGRFIVVGPRGSDPVAALERARVIQVSDTSVLASPTDNESVQAASFTLLQSSDDRT